MAPTRSDDSSDSLFVGRRLGDRFELLWSVDERARVWLAHDHEADERVVVKPVAAGEELRAARRLRHPHIVPIFDLHRDGDLRFMTLEWIEGEHAGSLRGKDPARILRMALQVVDALEHAHDQGVVHRDVKASNVLIDATGKALLTDFGTVSIADDAEGPTGGSRFAIGPQQLRGEPPVPSDDLYALGALLYDLLTGKPPFWPEPSDEDVLDREPPSLASVAPGLPAGLATVVGALLSKDAAARPDLKTVRASLRAALERIETGRRRPELKPPPRRPPSRGPSHGPASASVRPEPALPPVVGAPLPRSGVGWGPVVLLVILAVAALGVFVLLPRFLELGAPTVDASAPAAPPAPAPEPVASVDSALDPASVDPASLDPTPVDPAPVDPMVEAAERRRARGRLEELAQAVDRFQERDVAAWGGAPWRELEAAIERGREHFAERRWTAALQAWEPTEAALEGLEADRRRALEQAMASASAALGRGDAGAARASYEAALRIEPGHGPARAGLRRAEVWDRVAGLVADASAAEGRGAWVEASRLYAQALALDPASGEARSGVDRTRRHQARDAFGRAVGRGYEALAAGDFEAARRAFDEAEATPRAGNDAGSVLADARAQLADAERLAKIESLRRAAAEHEQAERWRQAEAAYEAVLTVDPVVGFALDGRERSRARAELQERLDFHLENPDRLSTAAVWSEAERLLGRARAVEEPGPEHRRRVAALGELVERYGEPITAEIVSDQATQVWIYKVGRLGTFDRRTVELRPGVYTVAGSRDGYRDVRLQWTLEPGSNPEPLVVRCEEKI